MKKNVIVTVSEQYLHCLGTIAEKLTSDGLKIRRQYEFGVIIGEIEEKQIKKILSHKEVVSCSQDKKIQLPPSGSDVQ